MLDKAEARQVAQKYAIEVTKNLDPECVVLFGSFVNGTPHIYSDIDIAVVFNDFQGDWLNTTTLLQTFRQGIDNDDDTYIEPHLLDIADDRSGFLEHVMETGEILYEKERGI